jgi:hypothetical protein
MTALVTLESILTDYRLGSQSRTGTSPDIDSCQYSTSASLGSDASTQLPSISRRFLATATERLGSQRFFHDIDPSPTPSYDDEGGVKRFRTSSDVLSPEKGLRQDLLPGSLNHDSRKLATQGTNVAIDVLLHLISSQELQPTQSLTPIRAPTSCLLRWQQCRMP